MSTLLTIFKHPPDVIERLQTNDGNSSDERRFVTIQAPFRAHVAFGVLSLDSDMQALEL